MMITCRTFVEFLMDYLSGELPASQREEFESHLDVCTACVTYMNTYRQTIALGRAACAEEMDAIPADVPEDLVKAVLAAREKGK